jgi:DNA-binding NarL/FixJ family response regulator
MLEDHATRVTVLYRDPLLSAGLIATLRDESDIRISGADQAADVFVADYEQGMALIAQAQGDARHGRVPNVLILTGRDSEPEIRHALERGARGYLTAGCGQAELVEAVRTLNRGARYVGTTAARRLADSVACEGLTARETDVLRLVVEGDGNKTIAKKLGIAVGTVKSHMKAIFQKLEASSRTQVAAVADRRGLLAIHPLTLHKEVSSWDA